MAVEASFLNGTLFEFCFFYRITHVLMTTVAKLVSRCQEIVLVFCGMGIVAFYTIPLGHDLMGTESFFGQHAGMALEADFVRLHFQHFAVGGCVGIMAARAFSGLDRRVEERELQLLLKGYMAVQADLPLRSGLQPELVLLGFRGRAEDESERRNKRREQPVTYMHRVFFHRFSPAI